MTRIYTRSGDQGKTGLADGQRVKKSSPVIGLIGLIDDLNAQLGLVRSLQPPKGVETQFTWLQHKLFDLGAQIAQYKGNNIKASDIETLESWIDDWQGQLEPLKQFILPAGTSISCHTQVARSRCREAERSGWELAGDQSVVIETEVIQFLNRLSDYLFVVARVLNDGDEVFWAPQS